MPVQRARVRPAAGFQQGSDQDHEVSGNVYVLEGAGGNIAASVGEDGIVIVDDQFAPLADKIRPALKTVSDKPLRFIINTHYHFDHTGGDLPLHDATMVAHDNVRKRLETGGALRNGGSLKMHQEASPKEALPVVTFSHDLTIHVNGEDIRVLHAPERPHRRRQYRVLPQIERRAHGR